MLSGGRGRRFKSSRSDQYLAGVSRTIPPAIPPATRTMGYAEKPRGYFHTLAAALRGADAYGVLVAGLPVDCGAVSVSGEIEKKFSKRV